MNAQLKRLALCPPFGILGAAGIQARVVRLHSLDDEEVFGDEHVLRGLQLIAIELPGNFVNWRVGVHTALEIDIVVLLNILKVQLGAQLQRDLWFFWNSG
ncbi:hypothetical protein MRX96_057801 [Rhipicephalus microplus]